MLSTDKTLLIDHETDANLDLQLIADNYSTHKHHKVKTWLARHPRFHMHLCGHKQLMAQHGGAMVSRNHHHGEMRTGFIAVAAGTNHKLAIRRVPGDADADSGVGILRRLTRL